MSFQHALMHLYPPVVAFAFLVINPALTFLLLRRAGVRGALLGLALVSPVSMVLGGLVFPLMMETIVHHAMNDDLWPPLWVLFKVVPPGSFVAVQIARSIFLLLGCIAPLAILAMLKWPVLNNSRDQVEI
ncbi:hypothetical protein IQ03_00769 [Gemmobacter caeni]|jgi:hypothetical protein|uniref:Uncharacterized protein n=1 Tax=Gemmobacter caeni TaxID=589035 RepID=A0A2T6B6J2_9RHOB|nr:hypothetical protein [Gemmobacter caeni]PTX51686.1 hypothetical protein C8N34_103188 [Gemmobacter caeni]TWJ03814.1 hypothetical protein IQ03_00769 [Gemmobacter caeni]